MSPSHGTDPTFALVGGCMRSGTTFTAGWLGRAIRGPKLAVRESHIPNFAHGTLTLLDFHQRDHEFGFRYPEDSPERARMVARLREAILGMYADKGWRPGSLILDKVPYALSDAASFYDHLAELFPDLRLIYLVRDPLEVIASMRARTWGRGPWPRTPLIAPVNLHLRTELENVIGDIPPDAPGEPAIATGPRRRSIEQCCLHYELALEGFLAARASQDALVVWYADLAHGDACRRMIGEFLGREVGRGEAFAPKTGPVRLSAEEQQEIGERLGNETLDRVAELRERARRSLDRHRAAPATHGASRTGPAPTAG